MTRDKQDAISSKLRAARETLSPITGKHPIPAHKTTSLCQQCFSTVYRFTGGLTLDEDGRKHVCGPVKHDTTRPPPMKGQ